MLYRLYNKNKLNFALVFIAAYVVLFPLADNLSNSLGQSKLITALLGAAFTAVLLGFICRHGLTKEYGLCAFKGKMRDFLFFVPLAVMMSANLWNGVKLSAPPLETALFIFSMLCVGFIEEIIFRGLLFTAMRKDSFKMAVLVSSLTFGIGHISNLLRGAELVSTLLQMCYASAIGFTFTAIFCRGKSLLPCIIAHGIFNSLSLFSVQGSQTSSIVTSIVLCVISVAYALWIWKNANLKEGKYEKGTV